MPDKDPAGLHAKELVLRLKPHRKGTVDPAPCFAYELIHSAKSFSTAADDPPNHGWLGSATSSQMHAPARPPHSRADDDQLVCLLMVSLGFETLSDVLPMLGYIDGNVTFVTLIDLETGAPSSR
jgi:hypothetical protein